jgi:hypothetical protein
MHWTGNPKICGLNPGQGNLIDISVDSNNFTFIAQYPGKIS